jgi:5-methylcytosine-specific restriction endonuclease McrBC GTP-binding regulatory subunit McrB
MKEIEIDSDLYRKVLLELNTKNNMDKLLKLLEANKNLILTGAPGTGKTYLAKEIAKTMIGAQTDDDLEKSDQFGFVQFHPSYDYTDFVEGLRPTKPDENGNIGFELKNGIFKKFCEEAKKDTDKKFVFVIDEINRGEISKIFGELFFSIDPGYRGEIGSVKTQYSNLHDDINEMFYVPENVYIIGTMNDIDRSVESFDFAMRRRFVWREITAEESQQMFDNESWKDEASKRMNNLNTAIENIEGLNSSYHIGAAYFKNNLPKYNDGEKWDKLWELHLKPLLSEYLRGMSDQKEKLESLENAYYLK